MKRKNLTSFVVFTTLVTASLIAFTCINYKRDSFQPTKVDGSSTDFDSFSRAREQSGSSGSSVPARPLELDRQIPEPPARQWSCVFREEMPDHLLNRLHLSENPAGGQLKTIDGSSTFRNKEIRIPFAEFEHVMRLDDSHYLFVWRASEEALPVIDGQHHRIVQRVFGFEELGSDFHYIFSIRDFGSDEISIVSIPIPKNLIVEVQLDEQARAPGWIKINRRKEGELVTTSGWLYFSLHE